MVYGDIEDLIAQITEPDETEGVAKTAESSEVVEEESSDLIQEIDQALDASDQAADVPEDSSKIALAQLFAAGDIMAHGRL